MRKDRATSGIILDANVLIDYAKSAPYILKLVSENISPVYVASPVLFEEVNELNDSDIKKIGIDIIEPTFQQIQRAKALRKERTSLSDKDVICFVLAKDNSWTCLTNDKTLRTYCSKNKITCVWGLEIMLYVVSCGKLAPGKALKIAVDIRLKNSFIKQAHIDKFKKKLNF